MNYRDVYIDMYTRIDPQIVFEKRVVVRPESTVLSFIIRLHINGKNVAKSHCWAIFSSDDWERGEDFVAQKILGNMQKGRVEIFDSGRLPGRDEEYIDRVHLSEECRAMFAMLAKHSQKLLSFFGY